MNYKAIIDSPDLDIDENCVMVMKNVGTERLSWMPEVGKYGFAHKAIGKRNRKDIIASQMDGMSGNGLWATGRNSTSLRNLQLGSIAFVQNAI